MIKVKFVDFPKYGFDVNQPVCTLKMGEKEELGISFVDASNKVTALEAALANALEPLCQDSMLCLSSVQVTATITFEQR